MGDGPSQEAGVLVLDVMAGSGLQLFISVPKLYEPHHIKPLPCFTEERQESSILNKENAQLINGPT